MNTVLRSSRHDAAAGVPLYQPAAERILTGQPHTTSDEHTEREFATRFRAWQKVETLDLWEKAL